jgi:tetratricopeptide (TPR) repeat protein
MRALLLLATLLAPLPLAAQPIGAPRPDANRPDARNAATDALLDGLKQAGSELEASSYEGKLRESWLRAGSPVAALLLGKGTRNLRANAEEDALDDFDAALVLDPNYMEAFNRRAIARAALGDYRGALADVQEVLLREPRHFGALQTLSRLAEAREDFTGALRAWEKVADLAPNLPGVQERLKALRIKAQGEES